MDRIQYLDGIRAFSLLLVIFFHQNISYFHAGFLGVDFFFVLSGYLIANQIIAKQANNSYSFLDFIGRRLRRTIPAFFVLILFCSFFFYFVLTPSQSFSFGKSLLTSTFALNNFTFWLERGYYDLEGSYKPLLHTWSLSVEIQLYILFGFLAYFFSFNSRKGTFILLIFLVVSLFLSEWMSKIHNLTSFYMMPTRAWEMLFGALLSNADKKIITINKSNIFHMVMKVLSYLGICLVVYSLVIFDEDSRHPGFITILPLLGIGLMIISIQFSPLIKKFLELKILVSIGLISFSLYLYHYPIQLLANYLIKDNLTIKYLFIYSLLPLISIISYFYIENIFRDHLLIKNKVFLFVILIAAFLIFIIGISAISTKGWLYRYPENIQRVAKYFISPKNTLPIGFDKAILKKFHPKSDRKIILIGDSYAKDIYNAIHFSLLSSKLDVSTFKINKECGNLYLSKSFEEFIPKDRVERCKFLGWYDNEELKKRIIESDEIWLASSWYDWTANLLPESIYNLTRDFNKKILVFGPKNFGNITEDLIMNSTSNSRYEIKNKINPEVALLNRKMKKLIPKESYIDTLELICNNDFECNIFLAESKLISHDGAHLTLDGARFLGDRLYDVIIPH